MVNGRTEMAVGLHNNGIRMTEQQASSEHGDLSDGVSILRGRAASKKWSCSIKKS